MPSPSANPRLVTIGLIQEIWRADPDAHARALRTAAQSAAERGAQLICLQELTLHRYFGDVRKRAFSTWPSH
jgi:N-carbamoylputrescine amidase